MADTSIETKTNDAAIIEQALIGGDLSKLSAGQRTAYYQRVCESVGLNPFTKPFDYITLNGKLTLYPRRDATDQLRSLRGVSCWITSRERMDDVYIVTAKAKDGSGREDESTGVVTIGNLKGDTLANALMKAETKAKRRVTLSICGLGWMDESELETVAGVRHVQVDDSGEIVQPTATATAIPMATDEQADKIKTLLKQKFGDTRGKLASTIAFVLEDQAPEHARDMTEAQAGLVIDYLAGLEDYAGAEPAQASV